VGTGPAKSRATGPFGSPDDRSLRMPLLFICAPVREQDREKNISGAGERVRDLSAMPSAGRHLVRSRAHLAGGRYGGVQLRGQRFDLCPIPRANRTSMRDDYK
jgi:hypothetical protein